MILAHALALMTRGLRIASDSFAEALRLRRRLGRRFQTEE
jgi:hypothetical protein